MVPIVGDIVLAQPAGMYGEDMEGIGEPEETMQMLMQRFSFLETAWKESVFQQILQESNLIPWKSGW